VKLVFLFIFLTLVSCSLNNRSDLWNKDLNLVEENLNYSKDYSIEEYEKILNGYNDRTNFPNIN
jgi:hypothetical protein